MSSRSKSATDANLIRFGMRCSNEVLLCCAKKFVVLPTNQLGTSIGTPCLHPVPAGGLYRSFHRHFAEPGQCKAARNDQRNDQNLNKFTCRVTHSLPRTHHRPHGRALATVDGTRSGRTRRVRRSGGVHSGGDGICLVCESSSTADTAAAAVAKKNHRVLGAVLL